MGQPTPPGDIPLYDGLGPEWNDIVGALPEDQRATLAPKLKERLDSFEPLKAYEDFHKSGVTPDQISGALNLFSVIENNPRQVIDTIAKHLNLTVAEATAAVEEMVEEQGDNSELNTLKQQVDALTKIALAQREQTTQERVQAEAEASIDRDLEGLRKKYGAEAVDDEEIIMRMVHQDMTAEEAFKAYSAKVEKIRARRAAPMVIGGSGGALPKPAIDPTKLNSGGTKDLVAQMMQQAVHESKR